MKSVSYKYILIIGMLLLGWSSIYANPDPVQDKTRTRLKAYYAKNADNNKVISIGLIQGSGKTMASVANAEVGIYALSEDEEQLLANIYTDENGEASLLIEGGYNLPKDEEGYTTIIAKFNGDDALGDSDKKVKFIDLDLTLSFEEQDSTRFIVVKASRINAEGKPENVEDVDVKMGVQRLYSTLYLLEATTGSKGTAKFEFPNDIPGDSIGLVTVLVKIDDDKNFGTITQTAQVDWGTRLQQKHKNGRTLYGEQAPLWMIIAVIVILTGAWFNFLLAIYKVYKIRGLDPQREDNLASV